MGVSFLPLPLLSHSGGMARCRDDVVSGVSTFGFGLHHCQDLGLYLVWDVMSNLLASTNIDER